MIAQPILSVQGLVKHFPVRRGLLLSTQLGSVKAVDGVGFELMAGDALAVVRESGCGKSTTGRLILRLIERTAGGVTFDGQDGFALGQAALPRLLRDMPLIVQ